jgi:Flp pilus assembly protein TadD
VAPETESLSPFVRAGGTTFRIAPVAILAALICGCGPQVTPVEPSQVSSAAENFDRARGLMARKAWSEAETALSSAIEARGLRSDSLAEALEWRAKCRLELGRFDEAIQDVDTALLGEETATMYAVRGAARMKLNDRSGAREDYRKAQSLDPTVKLPAGI